MADYGGNIPQGGAYPAGGGYASDSDDDLRGASEHASRSAGDSADKSLFSTVVGLVANRKKSLADEDLDEDDAVKQHKRYYDEPDDNDADDRSLGSAAAMQALKMFSGGGSGSAPEGNSKSAFIGLAMAEASKLFDQKASEGKVSSDTSKESAVMKAGEMALKFYLKSGEGGSGSSGGGDGGGSKTSGLLSLASKFMK